MSGTLFLLGVGPGDPELITLKAVRILDEVAVVAYPTAGEAPGLALGIAQTHINPHAALLPVSIPMQLEREPAQAAYDEVAARIRQHLGRGDDVAYLCEGDPLFYGSAMYILERLGEAASVVVVPGVTSLTAAAAALPRPLAARNEVLKVLPAPLPDEVLRRELEGAESVAIIKVGRHFERIRALLIETGYAEGARIIEHASGEEQRITALLDVPSGERPYFSTILCYRGGEAWGDR